MRVIILCGGMGTRLREHTETRPKPMVEVGGKPILWHIMKGYAAHGMKSFILALGYKGSVIREYFLNYQAHNQDFTVRLGRAHAVDFHGDRHDADGWEVTLAETGEASMTGARVWRAARFLPPSDDLFCMTYGDGVANVDITALLAWHKKHGKLATVTGVRPQSRFGELRTAGSRVESFNEKPQMGQGLINGGFFVFHRDFLRYLSEDASCVLEREPLERCAADGQLQAFEHTGYWQCMDTYRDWQHLQQTWESGQAPWKVW